MKITGNEPAMPVVLPFEEADHAKGLTIRQQFAMAAMQGLLASNEYENLSDDRLLNIGKAAVTCADGLIEALNK